MRRAECNRVLWHRKHERPQDAAHTAVHLFDWDGGREIWPPPRAPPNSMPPSYHPGANWSKDNERRAAAQRAEEQRIANYYARQTQQQEERENAEARERFAEGQRKMR